MVKIGKKSFIGQMLSIAFIILWVSITRNFNLTSGQAFLIVFITPIIIYIIGFVVYKEFFDLKQNHHTQLEKLMSEIEKNTDPFEKKKIIIRRTKNLQLSLYNIKCIYSNSRIEDDEFWIEFFLTNVKKIDNTNPNLVDYRSFLSRLKKDESRAKLRNILISKGIIDDEIMWW